MKKVKAVKMYAPVDKRGTIWVHYLESSERKAWAELERGYGTNKREAKAEGFSVIQVYVLSANRYEIREIPDEPDEDEPIDERKRGMDEYAENKKSFNRKVISEAGGEG